MSALKNLQRMVALMRLAACKYFDYSEHFYMFAEINLLQLNEFQFKTVREDSDERYS